jgi:hypothetical protein
MASHRKKFKYAKKLGPNDPSHMEYVVDRFSVLEVSHSPCPGERVVYRGCDEGSALVVAEALTLYSTSEGVAVRRARQTRQRLPA